ncbi:MAG: HDIG domain-containing protein [Phycisphaerales bacterium]|nr:HDIG domain-containing protein [Phycisphaerales bacterium]
MLLRRDGGAPGLWSRITTSPSAGWGLLIAAAFVAVCGGLAIWTRQQPLVAVGQVMNRTALVRVKLLLVDQAETNRAREEVRQRTPRVYNLRGPVIAQLRASLENLPKALANVETVAGLAEEVSRQFRITPESLAAVKGFVNDGQASQVWMERVDRLMAMLMRKPLLDDLSYQRQMQSLNTAIEARAAGEVIGLIPHRDVMSIKDPDLGRQMIRFAGEAGFEGATLLAVASRLTTSPEATYEFDEAATVQQQDKAAAAVPLTVRESAVGQTIFKRGDVLDPAQLELYKQDLRAYQQQDSQRWTIWLRNLSLVAAVSAVALAVGGYIALFCPRVARNPGRTGGIAGVLAGALAVACVGSVASPAAMMMCAVAPTVFVAVLLVIAYDQRVALAMSMLQGVLVCIALDQPIGVYALMVTGTGVAVWQLKEVRDRSGVIRMGVYAGLALAFGTVLVSLIDRPISLPALRQAGVDAGWAGGGGLLVGIITLAILPTIERAFGITTGMTLIELRDPKQPLLRQLQQRAPGTYNHSLNVASIAESAAETIGANSLLTYVGALYHDIGKTNKPEYFVENQSGGPNKHDKLSPAMSLLVIVGHVKDGVAMAQEFGLPRSIQHFIEAHHGTTLVEYFYSRARRQAGEAGRGPGASEPPQEVEYRYPGPKPRNKEVAIVMLADAVESATRTMAEPTPSRIDALVRALAQKRLEDGQFEECDMTFRELQTIGESISKSVASIYHGRVAYPSTSVIEEKRA